MYDRYDEWRGKLGTFGSNYSQLFAYERSLLDEFGLEGAHFLLKEQGYQPTREGEPSCPWSALLAVPLDVRGIADAVFRPLMSRLPTFLLLLNERLMFVVPATRNGRHYLCYFTKRSLYDGTPYFEVLSGGAPNPSPELAPRLRELGWLVPKSLREFYLVHDGLTPGDEVNGIWESDRLVDLGEMMDPIAAEIGRPPEDYRFTDLLCFREDGAGNGENFHRDGTNDSDPPCVDWDHETWEISGEETFFEFADRHLAGQIADEE
jgi:hypothetical protein